MILVQNKHVQNAMQQQNTRGCQSKCMSVMAAVG